MVRESCMLGDVMWALLLLLMLRGIWCIWLSLVFALWREDWGTWICSIGVGDGLSWHRTDRGIVLLLATRDSRLR